MIGDCDPRENTGQKARPEKPDTPIWRKSGREKSECADFYEFQAKFLAREIRNLRSASGAFARLAQQSSRKTSKERIKRKPPFPLLSSSSSAGDSEDQV
jgi:hypothetical protein